MSKKIDEKLAKAIKENNLVLFIGAGLSYNFVNKDGQILGDWKNLVKQILNNITGLYNLKPLVDEFDPITVLDLIEKKGKKGDVIGFVRRFYSLHADKNDYSLHKKLCSLSNKIITTNYDNAFEKTDDDFATKTASFGIDSELDFLYDPFKKTLFKLHGSINDGNKMVLFPSDYETLYNRNSEDAERIILHLQNLITSKTILFIGCGMGDFQINNIFSNIQRILGTYKKHYIIAKETRLDSKLQAFLELIPIDNWSEIETKIDEFLSIKEADSDKIMLEKLLKEATEKFKNESDRIKSLSLDDEKNGIKFALNDDFEKGIEFFKIATEFDPNNAEAFNNWGIALYYLAKMKQDESLFEQAFEKNQEAVRLNPEYANAFNNWGNALSDLAKMKQEESLFKQAFEKYQEAVRLNPEYANAFNNWGIALSDLATMKQDKSLFKQAFEKYQEAVRLNPESANAFNNWGTALYNLAKMKQDESLFKQAFEKYQEAVRLNPEYADAFNNWGNALSDLAKMKQDESLFKQAFEKYQEAVRLNPIYSPINRSF